MASTIFDRLQASASSVLLWAVAAALLVAPAAHAQDGCIADVDGDGIVNGNDLATVLVGWGSCAGCAGDINGNGVVNGEDLASVLVRWSGTCAPTVTGISPDAGPLAGGSVVTITGDRLLNPTSVTFGGTPATILSSTRSAVSVLAPARPAGVAAIVMTTQGGSVGVGNFSYYGAPTIAGVAPSSGNASGGHLVTIMGSGFYGSPVVRFGKNLAVSTVVVSPTRIEALTPAGSVGASVSVSVATDSGMTTVSSAYHYADMAVPSWATLVEAVPDPAVVHSEALRSAIISTGYAWRVRDEATQIELLLIPPGTFSMGCSPSNNNPCATDESPTHTVTLTSPFYLGRYEVTQAQWVARFGSNPSYNQHPSAEVPAAQVQDRPVEMVSWNMAQAFLASTSMRLPTEAEWEYAYRAGTTTAYHSAPGSPSGSNDAATLDSIAWWYLWPTGGNANNQSHPVGLKAANGFGLHDMSGNVHEWVSDWHGSYSGAAQMDPIGPPSGEGKILRGGAWWYNASNLRASARSYNAPVDYADPGSGFRVARNP